MKISRLLPLILILTTTLTYTSCASDVPQSDQNIIDQVLTLFATGFSFQFLEGNPELFIGFLRAIIFFLVFTLVFVAIDTVPLFANTGAKKKGPKIIISIIIGLITVLVPINIILTFLFVYTTITWAILLLGPVALVIWYVVRYDAHTKFSRILNGILLILLAVIVNTMNTAFKEPQSIIQGIQSLPGVEFATASQVASGLPNILWTATNWVSIVLGIWGIIWIISGFTQSSKDNRTKDEYDADAEKLKAKENYEKSEKDYQKWQSDAQAMDQTELNARQGLQQLSSIANIDVAKSNDIIKTIDDILNSIPDVGMLTTEKQDLVVSQVGNKAAALINKIRSNLEGMRKMSDMIKQMDDVMKRLAKNSEKKVNRKYSKFINDVKGNMKKVEQEIKDYKGKMEESQYKVLLRRHEDLKAVLQNAEAEVNALQTIEQDIKALKEGIHSIAKDDKELLKEIEDGLTKFASNLQSKNVKELVGSLREIRDAESKRLQIEAKIPQLNQIDDRLHRKEQQSNQVIRQLANQLNRAMGN